MFTSILFRVRQYLWLALAMVLVAVMASSTAPSPAQARSVQAAPTSAHQLDANAHESAAQSVLRRALGGAADQVEFDLVDRASSEERFTIAGRPGRVRITATTPIALSAGAGWYLKHVVHAAVNLGNPTPSVPSVLPAPSKPITRSAHEGSRFAFNDTNEGYTDPYLDWEGWQRLLDNLALHGINQMFLSIGTDAVYAELLQRHGYTEAEARAWIPQPAHQPWWVLQNISSTQQPISRELLDERAHLARRVIERAQELGITPVLPGYFGTVPTDFAERNSGANVVPQGTWNGYQRPGWLDPTSTSFTDVAADYYQISQELLGTSTAYKMDPLHEGGSAGNVPVPAAAASIEEALQTARPGATWVLLGWERNPSTELLSGVADRSRLLIVDGLSDTTAVLDPESKWPGTPYAFGSIYNFGGNTSIGAISAVWLDRYFAARSEQDSALTGVAILPEGFYNNPAAFELLSELPWMDSKPDHEQWFRDYAVGRYGTSRANDAWDRIASTAYEMEPIGTHSESHDSLFAAQPSLTTTKARACCAKGVERYDLARFARALPALLRAAPAVKQRAAYEYDLTDVTRQVIANQSRTLLPQINAAYRAGDVEQFDDLTETWMTLIDHLDKVLATNEDFLLGAYAARAEKQNGAVGSYDLQNLLTTWGTRASFGLHDYANREWQGLTGDLYASRWRTYFAAIRTSMTSGEPPEQIDWFNVDETWAQGQHAYPTKPRGEIVARARESLALLAGDPGTLEVEAPETLRPGSPATITATVRNVAPQGAINSARLSLTAPDGITLAAVGSTTLRNLKPGESGTVTWRATVDEDSGDVLAPLVALGRIKAGGTTTEKRARATALTGADLGSEWHQFTTEADTTFASSGDRLAIRTTGRDMSRTTRRFAAIWRDETATDSAVATVRVDHQVSEGSRPWARTGILVSSDITAKAAPLAMLALTPDHGCVLSWTNTTSGSIDRHAEEASFDAPVWLRLTRVGDTFVGACSSDGASWTTVGTATPAGISDSAQIGLYASAVNSGGSDRVIGAFSDWSVRRP